MISATENRLNYEMEDARRDLNWIDKQIEALHEKRRKRYRDYYRAKHELKTLNDKAA